MNDNYNNRIESLIKKNRDDIRILNAIIYSLDFGDKNVNKKLTNMILKMQSADIDKKSHYFTKMKNYLERFDKKYKISKDKLDNYFDNYIINKGNITSLDTYKIIGNIVNKPINSYHEYVRDYLYNIRTIEIIKKERSSSLLNQTKYQDIKEESIEPVFSYNLSEFSKEDSHVSVKQDPYKSNTSEETKAKIYADLDEKLQGNNKEHFTYEEQKRIQQVFPDMNYKQMDLLNEGIDQSVILNNINKSGKIEPEKMMELGYNIVFSMTDCLLYDTATLTKKSGVANGIKEYQKAYEIYQKAYSKLNSSEKDQVNSKVKQNKQYINIFWPNTISSAKIIDPEHLRKTINMRVMGEAIRNGSNYFYGNYNNLLRITSLMDITELNNFYHQAHSQLAVYNNNNNPQFDVNLQMTFASIIRGKMKNVVVNSISKDESIEKRNTELAAIIENIMHEKPYSNDLANYANLYNSKEISAKMVSDYEIKKEAKSKIYNMNGFNKSIAKITGKWNKYMKSLQQEQLSEEDIERLSRL